MTKEIIQIKTYFVIGFKMHHQLLKCCIIIITEYAAYAGYKAYFRTHFFFVLFLPLAITQTDAVSLVLGVNKQLHLKLSPQQGFGSRLFFLLDGFNLCLKKTFFS